MQGEADADSEGDHALCKLKVIAASRGSVRVCTDWCCILSFSGSGVGKHLRCGKLPKGTQQFSEVH